MNGRVGPVIDERRIGRNRIDDRSANLVDARAHAEAPIRFEFLRPACAGRRRVGTHAEPHGVATDLHVVDEKTHGVWAATEGRVYYKTDLRVSPGSRRADTGSRPNRRRTG